MSSVSSHSSVLEFAPRGRSAPEARQRRAIRFIGMIFSAESGLTKSVSAVGRILIGMLAGLPPTALAVNATVAFTASALLEFPTGLLTDLFGRARMSRLGFLSQAAASASLFISLISFPRHPQVMWTFLVLEALLDALGSALISGSVEALFQEVIVKESALLPAADAAKFRESGLLQAEAFGRHLAFGAPILGLSAALYLNQRFGGAHYLLLVHAAGWVAIAEGIRRLARTFALTDEAPGRMAERIAAWRSGVLDLLGGRGDAGASGLLGTFGQFMHSSVEAYYMISVLRTLAEGTNAIWLPALVLTLNAAVGQLGRSFLLPHLSRRFANVTLVIFGLVGQVALSLVMISGAEFLTGAAWTTLTIAYPVVFGLLIGLVIRPTIGMLFNDTRAEVHATVMSLRSALALLMLGLYSAALSFGVGSPSIPWIMVMNILVSVVGMILLTLRIRHEA